ncbi:MAG: hypothetical protein CBD58_05150 [bacterium TMED198]|nr:MAG: hypothetical protein CBD58_05150 [bacterium TMED198]|tara:strand:+ start:335 stop:667 length:333 start_codon:yes stop_codon:yes gene_type:complete
MKNLSNYLLDSLVKVKENLSPGLHKFLGSLSSKSEKLTALSRNKIELEKVRLDLKKKYAQLGIYVSNQYELNNATDFSADINYTKMLNELKNSKNLVNRIKEERKKIRGR